ncbi:MULTISPECIES: ribosome biogenesis GTP-binding protein YihA/YsxC [Pseudovibrio]|uniref:ribosome biogenesis GTP-binding protein YihA/YsxC n=1 Tax=Stappiaceae TaxID=2821832 RepID=UPI0023670506|nr:MULTISPECIES: ribosome biogenesis GTP-binding protein YihA/YsxC [Pseudovibrio]MDD7910112.1 ribosome biogenesis GTP-binding protein YihA/YsxC [Pseudovibrio exalbescens]MDX5592395.1 ribosome biogenesis GTP-binding protein YihA/YsxC [Pseudovibrio sp. SPO723]
MTPEEEKQKELLEAGRLLFAREWDFLTSVAQLEQLPPLNLPEIAFAGRSNVGKSSLINALTGRKGLARTSNTPGRTQMLNFFTAPESPINLVDMPGYGYAQAPKGLVDAWTDLVFDYLRGRATLRRVFTLIDSRHGLKKNDLDAMEVLDKAAVPYQVILTKGDKLKPGQLKRVEEETLQKLSRRPAAYPEVISTSSEKGWGLPEVRAEVYKLANQ